METQFWIGFANMVVLDLVLSGDNAMVIGLAARYLPERQRKQAILYGTLAAVLLRVTLTGLAAWLLLIPFLQSLGGLLLLWIAVKLLLQDGRDPGVSPGRTLRDVVKTIIVADVVMSLDNVLAVAGAAQGSFVLILFGLGLSIPILMWGSQLVVIIVKKIPWIVYVGSGILGYTAGQLIVKDPIIEEGFLLSRIIPVLLTVIVLIVGPLWRRFRAASHHSV